MQQHCATAKRLAALRPPQGVAPRRMGRQGVLQRQPDGRTAATMGLVGLKGGRVSSSGRQLGLGTVEEVQEEEEEVGVGGAAIRQLLLR